MPLRGAQENKSSLGRPIVFISQTQAKQDLQNDTTYNNLNSYSLRILLATCENGQPKNSKIQSLYYSAIQMVFARHCIHGI